MDRRISNFCQVAGIRRYTITDGKGAGLKVLEADNGRIRFLLNESRALDIMQLWHRGTNISFVSKNGFTASSGPFAGRFEGGMLYTCGLDNIGDHPGYVLHGTHHLRPALVTRAECTEEGITIEAEIADTELFGRNLVFKRRITTGIGSDTVEIHDTLENRAYRDERYCMIYHINLGYPMLDSCGRISADLREVKGRTPWAAQHIGTHLQMTGPVDGQEEMCYYLKFKEPGIMYTNEKLGKRFALRWSQDTLPSFVEWKSMASGDYALGLEPCTSELDEGFEYRTVPAQGSVEFTVSVTVSDMRQSC